MNTQFPRQPENIRPICDEFCEAWFYAIDPDMRNARTWTPTPPDRQRIVHGARQLYEAKAYRPGFILWAVPEHLVRFPHTRYIASPFSLRYLWGEYAEKEKRTDGRRYLEGIEDE